MEIKGKLTHKDFDEIKTLAFKAISASNKKTAKQFTERLDFIQRSIDIEPYKRIVLSELISYVSAASGNVQEKDHWISAVNQSLFKLEPSFVEKDEK